MTFKKGDIIRCISDEYCFVSDGCEYTVAKNQADSEVYVFDNDGDPSDYPASDFEPVTPAVEVGRTLKLPLLFQTKDRVNYVLSRDSATEGNITAVNATTGELFTNQASEEKAIEYFRDGTWTVTAQVKLKQAVADAKAALEKAEKALADSPTYLA